MPKGGNRISRPGPKGAGPTTPSAASASSYSHPDPDSAIAELREAVRTREEFIAFAAHEMRNPITPIQLCVRLIRAAEASGDRLKLSSELDRLERLLNHFLRRTEVLLDVTRLISGRLHLEPAETHLSDLARGVIDDLNFLLMRSGSTLTADVGQNIVGLIDPTAFAQIAENLLSNAIKYGLGKPIEVRLQQCNGDALLAVRDYGLGISSADQARVFEPFERAVTRDDKPGFGLGLWVTRRLAEAMGGSITVSSQKGAGSVFVVRLPLNPWRNG
jgi:two-component system, OmpR family, sensor kinase